MRIQIESLVVQFDNIFNGNPWYGDGVIEKLEKIDSNYVVISPMGEIHSIIQLVEHMTAWKRYLIEKMNGNDAYKIVADSEVEWPSQSSAENWSTSVNELKETQGILIGDLLQKTDKWLLTTNPGTEFTFGTLVQGVIHHDIYHIGQIGIISKLIDLSAKKRQ